MYNNFITNIFKKTMTNYKEFIKANTNVDVNAISNALVNPIILIIHMGNNGNITTNVFPIFFNTFLYKRNVSIGCLSKQGRIVLI